MSARTVIADRIGYAGTVRHVWVLAALAACGDNRSEPLPYGLNDVSVLYPIDGELLPISTEAHGGPLLPRDVFDRIDVLTRPYEDFHIVAARLDPCFADLTLLERDPTRCERQLRLVAQPVGAGGAGDEGIHLLYVFDQAEYDELATAFLAHAHGDLAAPIDIRPDAGDLDDVIVAHAGAATLNKLTFVAAEGDAQWDFGGLHVEAGAFVDSPLPHLGDAIRQTTAVDRSGTVDIAPLSPEAMALAPLADTGAATDMAAALQDTLDLDNPRITHLDDADCSSCHVATRLRTTALDAGASLAGLEPFADDAFDLSLHLPDAVGASPTQQRGFGYLGTQPAWNQRVVNDSAAIARVMAELYPAP